MTKLMRRTNDPIVSLTEAMDRLFEQAFMTPFWSLTDRRWEDFQHMPADLYEDAGAYYLTVALPGVQPQDVNISSRDGVLVISGEFRPEAKKGTKPVWQELGSGSFRREIRLPTEFDADRAEAVYEHGLLKLTLPKAAHARSKVIKVKAA